MAVVWPSFPRYRPRPRPSSIVHRLERDALGQLLTEQSSAGGLHHHYDVVGASLKPNMTATVIRWVKPALIGRACACGKSIGIARPAMVHAEENRLRRARGMGPNQMLKRGKLEIRLMSQAIHNSLVKTGIITQQQVRTARRSATSFAKRKGCFQRITGYGYQSNYPLRARP